MVATTDPARLPELSTWYLNTNLPAPRVPSGEGRRGDWHAGEPRGGGAACTGLRMWVEQSYKQVKHALGWSDYQVRSDSAIRRHWQLVCCAFSFCWWACGEELRSEASPGVVLEPTANDLELLRPKRRRGGKRRGTRPPLPSWPQALRRVRAWLEPYVMLTRYWRAFTDRTRPKS